MVEVMRRRLVGTSYTRLEPGLASVPAYLPWVLGGMLMLTIERASRFVRSHALRSIFCARGDRYQSPALGRLAERSA